MSARRRKIEPGKTVMIRNHGKNGIKTWKVTGRSAPTFWTAIPSGKCRRFRNRTSKSVSVQYEARRTVTIHKLA